jgi:hypothetical protein
MSIAVVGVLTTACSLFGPTTKDEVCAEFDELESRVATANGYIDNLVFIQAGTLADVAERYDGEPDLTTDAEALETISDSNSTTNFELMAASTTIASMCNSLRSEQDGDGSEWAGDSPNGSGDGYSEDELDPSTDQTSEYEPPTTTVDPEPQVNGQAVSGPGGLTVTIPYGWQVGGSPAPANQQASDPADPQTFARFGASTPPNVALLAEIQAGESGNPNVQNGYQRIQLAETQFLGETAVDWEFIFVKDGITRHAYGRYWRYAGLGYVIYLSAPDTGWQSARPVFDLMASTAVINR